MGDNDVMMHVTLPNTHLQDCPLSQPCSGPKAHDHHDRSGVRYCLYCREYCICERLRAHGKRVLAEAREAVVVVESLHEMYARSPDGYVRSYNTTIATGATKAIAIIDGLIEAQS